MNFPHIKKLLFYGPFLAIFLLCGNVYSSSDLFGRILTSSGKIISEDRLLQIEKFPLTYTIKGNLPKGKIECFAMMFSNTNGVLYRLAPVGFWNGFARYYEMKRQKKSDNDIIKETGLYKNNLNVWLMTLPLSSGSSRYWTLDFFPWRSGEPIVPYNVINNNISSIFTFDIYGLITKEKLASKKINKLLFGIAPYGDVRKGKLDKAHAAMVVFR